MKVYISPSMQQYNKYAAGDTTEAEQCHRIGEYAAAAMRRCGIAVKLADAEQTAEQNVAESNAWGADYHICIHTNAANGQARDVVVFTSLKNSEDACARAVYEAIDVLDGHKSIYGVRTANYYEIKATSAKCIYVECEFHDNAELAEWIIANVGKLGEAIAKGMCVGSGIEYIEPIKDIFSDIDGSAHREAIEWLYEQGITKGYKDGTFRPNQPITRGEMATMLSRMYDAIKKEQAVKIGGKEVT